VAGPSIEFLRSMDLFADVPERALREIAESMARRTFAPGDVVLGQGEGGVGVFLIESGRVVVSKDGADIVTLGPGSHVGVIALLADSPRTATVTAETEVVSWGMTAWVFRPLLKNQPSVALKLLEELARQLAR
jgi:CRP/FNR family cyclic AMP-dependent transcriptional regulator